MISQEIIKDIFADAKAIITADHFVYAQKPDGWRHIFVPEGMTPQGGYDLCLKDFKCWKYCGDKSLNDVVAHEDRAAEKGSYVILVRDRLEADEENKNRSANDLAKANFSGITLTERLVFEDKVYDETKQHLDVALSHRRPYLRKLGAR